ncbi:MAG: glycosyltransferase [Sphingobacteriales bacterium]|nr:glycosyltransferase [Sphingobacteriales bacterium]
MQLYFLWFVQRKLSNYQPEERQTAKKILPVSVIICARNEAENLAKNLEKVLQQDYPDFEVIVVNDCSSDRSDDVLRDFQERYQHLKVVKIEEHPRYKTAKKFAATLGIKAASHEILIFTDADCEPASSSWIEIMASHYQNNETEIVLGYSPYFKERGFLNKLIRYETFQTALNYFSFALYGMPYMGVGRNLSYKKSLFFKGKGFAAHMHIPSGDDDLFVNQNATAQNVAIEVREDAQVWSTPKGTWKAYWQQKLRHIGAGKIYKKQHKVYLSLQASSAICFYALGFTGLILSIEPYFLLGAFLLRFLIQFYIFYKPVGRFQNKDLLWWFILLDPFYYIYLTGLNVVGLFSKKISWK